MSKHKPALPERLYYRLADAAQFLECSSDDLLHYGACGYLEICAAADDLFAQGIGWDELAGEDNGDGKGGIVSFPASRVFRWFDLFALSARQIGGIEKFSECKCSSSLALYRLTNGGLLHVAIDGIAQSGPLPIDEKCVFPDSRFDISASPPVDGQLFGEPIRVTATDLWVRTEELRRFQKEGSSHVRGDLPTPEETVFSGRSDKLAYLNQAAARVWANADPNDRATHPDNNTVAEWLEGKGYSQTMAARGATIIRPEWASLGRKPEE